MRSPRRIAVSRRGGDANRCGGEEPLRREEQFILCGVIIGETPRRDPLRGGRHADALAIVRIDRDVVTDHSSYGMATVIVPIARGVQFTAYIVPIVVVGIFAIAEITAILRPQRLVVVINAGIDIGDHDPRAGYPVCPDIRGIYLRDAPGNIIEERRGAVCRYFFIIYRTRQGNAMDIFYAVNLLMFDDSRERGAVRRDFDRIDYPKWLVRCIPQIAP